MFQYAAGRVLAERHDTHLLLDLSHYRAGRCRSFSLEPYGVRTAPAWSRIGTHLLQRFGRICTVSEPGFGYDPEFTRYPDNVLLDGYWQSRRYLELAGDAVYQWFELPGPVQQKLLSAYPEVLEGASVAVHLRRGDYVSNPATEAHHGVCEANYYETALQILTDRLAKPRFLIFTDDPVWARENFHVGCDFTVMSGKGDHTDVEEHYLMSQCAHHVIANSSYSWWAAWLARPRNGEVVAPRAWFADKEIDLDDLMPEDWIKI